MPQPKTGTDCTAIEIGPSLALPQIVGIVMGLSIAGGMLISGNIPNIVAAGRMKMSHAT